MRLPNVIIIGSTCLCGSNKFKLIVEGDNTWQGQTIHFQALKCSNCHLVRTNPPPLLGYASSSADQNERPRNEYWLRHYSNYYSNYRYSRLKPYLSPSTKNLEIGCAEGNFVEMIKVSGVKESVGVELSRERAEVGKSFGRDIRDVDIHKCNFSSNYFDIVQAHHLLEHVPNLHEFLDEVYRIIKPNGILYITVPRYNSIFVQNSPSWIGWFPHKHFWHFTEVTLAKLLKCHGFEPIYLNCIRSKNYFPPMAKKNIFYPAKISAKKLVNFSIKIFNLGDIIDVIFRAK